MYNVGFVNISGELPSIVIPVFAREENGNENFFIQKTDISGQIINKFISARTDCEIKFLDKRLLVNEGDAVLYGLAVNERTIYVDTLLNLSEKISTQDISLLPKHFQLSVYNLLNNKNEYIQVFKVYLESVARNYKLSEALNFLNNSVSLKGWSILSEMSPDYLRKTLHENLLCVDFFILENTRISVKFNDEKGLFLNLRAAALEVCGMLDEVYMPIIQHLAQSDIFDIFSFHGSEGLNYGAVQTNDSFGKNFALKLRGQKYLENAEKIRSRFQQYLVNMGRQEERLAFTIGMLLAYPQFHKIFLKHNDRAKSAKMGVQYLSVTLREFENFDDLETYTAFKYKIQLTIGKILDSWVTGDEDKFELFLNKWLLNTNLDEDVSELDAWSTSYQESLKRITNEADGIILFIKHLYFEDRKVSDRLFKDYHAILYTQKPIVLN